MATEAPILRNILHLYTVSSGRKEEGKPFSFQTKETLLKILHTFPFTFHKIIKFHHMPIPKLVPGKGNVITKTGLQWSTGETCPLLNFTEEPVLQTSDNN